MALHASASYLVAPSASLPPKPETTSTFSGAVDPFESSPASASLFDAENDNDATICAICLDPFDDLHTASTPTLLLPCCHCICRADAERIFGSDRKCPFDRQRLTAIQTNFALRDFIATNKRKEREKFVDEFAEVVEQMQKAEKEKEKAKEKGKDEVNPFEIDSETQTPNTPNSTSTQPATAPTPESTASTSTTETVRSSEEKTGSSETSSNSERPSSTVDKCPEDSESGVPTPQSMCCDECQELAAVFCNDCRLSLCSKCDLELIHKAKSFSTHQRIPLMERQPIEDFCAVHTKTAVSLYCERCGLLCCPLCPFHSNHRSHFHRMKDFKEIKPKFVTKLNSISSSAQVYQQILQEWLQRKRNAAAESCQEVLSKLPDFLQNLHVAIDRMGNRIADGVVEFQKTHEKKCAEFEQNLNGVNSAFEHMKKIAEKYFPFTSSANLCTSTASSSSSSSSTGGKADAEEEKEKEEKERKEEQDGKEAAAAKALRSASVSQLYRMNAELDKLRKQYERELSSLFHPTSSASTSSASSSTSVSSKSANASNSATNSSSTFVHSTDSINFESVKNLHIMLENHFKSFQLPLRKKILPPDFLAVKYPPPNSGNGRFFPPPPMNPTIFMGNHKRKKNLNPFSHPSAATEWDETDPFGMFFSASNGSMDSSSGSSASLGQPSSAATSSSASSSSASSLPGGWFLLPGSPAGRWMDDPFISAFDPAAHASAQPPATSSASSSSASGTLGIPPSASVFSFLSAQSSAGFRSIPLSVSRGAQSDPWTEMVELSPTISNSGAATAAPPMASASSAASSSAPSAFHFVLSDSASSAHAANASLSFRNSAQSPAHYY